MDFAPPFPLPNSEATRLNELRSFHILNTPPESLFDGLVELAAALAETPIAALSFIDAETQWLKAKVGTDICSVPRGLSFCSHTILAPETLVVPNLMRDPRFREHPAVSGEPGVRFYVGTPLVTSQRECVGTLCVADFRPRRISSRCLRLLERLAQQAVATIESDRLIARIGDSRQAA